MPNGDAGPEYKFMALAVEEAQKSATQEDPTRPRVGAVVVRDGGVLASAHRGEMKPGEHAEYTALERKLLDSIDVAGSTVYTTLEPCVKRGPGKLPCANHLIDRKVSRVVVGMLDPNQDITGKGILELRHSNVEVSLFPTDLMAKLEDLNRGFIRHHQTLLAVGSGSEFLGTIGFEKAFDSRGPRIKPEYDRALAAMSDRLDLMGFGQSALRQDYHSDFSQWAERAQVRILLLDPEHPSTEASYASQRDSEEANPAGSIGHDVREFVRATTHILHTTNRFQVRLYRCLPTINIFRVDEVMFCGPYLVGMQSRNMPTFRLNSKGSLFSCFMRHFEEVWSNDDYSRPLPAAWL